MGTFTLEKDFQIVQKELADKMRLQEQQPTIPSIITIENIAVYTDIIKKYDKNLYNHSLAVSLISGYIGNVIGLSDEEIDDLYVAGALHDIGKIYIPIQIITKAGRLDEVERIIIESHPAFSVYCLYENPEITHKILDMIKQHHEELNGEGYPLHLKGRQIGTGARVLAIADKFEAYTSKRSYHGERSLEETVSFILRQADKEILDRSIVEDFIDSLIA